VVWFLCCSLMVPPETFLLFSHLGSSSEAPWLRRGSI
jgi:hypothetical protein